MGSNEAGAVVVTGAGSGIGEGIAEAAAARGRTVVVVDRDAERAERVTGRLREGGARAHAWAADVRDAAALEALAEDVWSTVGPVGTLVNNAGVESTGYVWETEPRDFASVIAINLLGIQSGIRAFLPRMLAHGAPGQVVLVSSMAAFTCGLPQQAAYNASKHGVLALAECLHLELAEVGAPVTAHVVTPGPVRTRIFADAAAASDHGRAARDGFHDYVSADGLTHTEAGKLILAAVDAGEFWVDTHPAMREQFVTLRSAMLSERTVPEYRPPADLVS